MASFCKEGNKLDGASNFKAWKKRIDLVPIENEVMDYILGKVPKPNKDKTQEVVKYNKGEVRAHRIFFESIKDHLISFVSDLSTSKKVNDKLVKLYFVNITGQKISLRNQHYRTRISKEDDVENSIGQWL